MKSYYLAHMENKKKKSHKKRKAKPKKIMETLVNNPFFTFDSKK